MKDDESEAERNMRIARSVLDEETALDMARTFIKLTKVRITAKEAPTTTTNRKTETATNKKAKGQDNFINIINDHDKDKNHRQRNQ